MGRKVRRVPEGWDWPVGQIWKGYLSPYAYHRCKHCDGYGLKPGTPYKDLCDTWYDFEGTGGRWCNKITQDEVQALVDNNRLIDWTHDWVDGEWVRKDGEPVPTAEEINAANERPGLLGHDATNRWICIDQRAKRLGIEKELCPVCDGHGCIFPEDKFHQLSEEYEWIDPPTGEWWQLWETVSEGSPVSPAFATPEELADWLTDNHDLPGGGSMTRDRWLHFLTEQGWAPSLMGRAGHVVSGVEAMTGESGDE